MRLEVIFAVLIFDFYTNFPLWNVKIRFYFNVFGSQNKTYPLFVEEFHDFVKFFFVCHKILVFAYPRVCVIRARKEGIITMKCVAKKTA